MVVNFGLFVYRQRLLHGSRSMNIRPVDINPNFNLT